VVEVLLGFKPPLVRGWQKRRAGFGNARHIDAISSKGTRIRRQRSGCKDSRRHSIMDTYTGGRTLSAMSILGVDGAKQASLVGRKRNICESYLERVNGFEPSTLCLASTALTLSGHLQPSKPQHLRAFRHLPPSPDMVGVFYGQFYGSARGFRPSSISTASRSRSFDT
jgi:hypothetical protein